MVSVLGVCVSSDNCHVALHCRLLHFESANSGIPFLINVLMFLFHWNSGQTGERTGRRQQTREIAGLLTGITFSTLTFQSQPVVFEQRQQQIMDGATKMLLVFAIFVCILLQTTTAQDRCAGNECSWNPWNAWSVCSKTCGEGTRSRTRGLCCKSNEQNEFNLCLRNCNLTDQSLETETCGYVCPAGK